MENRRFFLLAALGVVLFLMYQSWRQDYGNSKLAPPAAAPGQGPAAEAPSPPAPAGASVELPSAAEGSSSASAAAVEVQTDRLRAEISLAGGGLRRVELLDYAYSKKNPACKIALLDDRDGRLLVFQSGFAGSREPLATPVTPYTASSTQFSLPEGADAVEVPLEHRDASGLVLRQTYRFRRGTYEVDLRQTVVNGTPAALDAGPYARFLTDGKPVGEQPPFIKTFSGLGLYEAKGEGSYRFRKISFSDLAGTPMEIKQQGGWLAVLQHYFFAAILPPAGETLRFTGKPAANQTYLAQYVGPLSRIDAGAEKTFVTRLYVGPNLQGTLDKIAPGLELTQDYGILTPIAEPLFWLLSRLHGLTHNWGAAIILLTLIVRAAMYKLSEAQYRSMAKMKKFGPRIQELKERYADDRERLNKAMMDLYKKEGFNPLAGCWPLLVQFPVFISLYWVLLQSVELRQAHFALWIDDLSAADPYYVLPVLFGITMFVQQKLSGQQMADPMQQKIMSLMPVFMTAFFAFFPAGLVLYWFVSNLTTITQQWFITRKLQRQGLA